MKMFPRVIFLVWLFLIIVFYFFLSFPFKLTTTKNSDMLIIQQIRVYIQKSPFLLLTFQLWKILHIYITITGSILNAVYLVVRRFSDVGFFTLLCIPSMFCSYLSFSLKKKTLDKLSQENLTWEHLKKHRKCLSVQMLKLSFHISYLVTIRYIDSHLIPVT